MVSAVSNIEDIKRLCAPIFTGPECQNIQWVGIFGSFARGEQNMDSDVDILVGYKDGTTWDELYQTGYHITKSLPEVLKRKVDLLHMRSLEIRGFVMLQALVTAKTVYEAGPWILENQMPAKAVLIDGHNKFKEALRLESGILKQMDTVMGQVSSISLLRFNY